jgi:ribosomal protein L3
MFVSGGLIARKKEMTSLLVDGKMIAVTILSVLPQKVVRAKTKAKD